MTVTELPWVEASIGLALVGAAGVAIIRDPVRGFRFGLAIAALAFGGSLMAWVSFLVGHSVDPAWDIQTPLFGTRIFVLDALGAPLLPLVGLLHFLKLVATTRTKMHRHKITASLVTEAVRLALFSCKGPDFNDLTTTGIRGWFLIALLAAGIVPPLVELVARRRSPRVFLVHMGLFLALLVGGWAGIERFGVHTTWAIGMVLAAVLLRCGTFPVHCWIADLFENASLGTALLFVAPLTGVLLAIRLVLPIAPDWALQSIGILSLGTAVYAAGMAVVQNDLRRFFAYLFLSHSSLVLLGLELAGVDHAGALSLTGSLCLWFSVTLSLGGFGLTIRALESRFGRMSLDQFRGLYDNTPVLAVCFLLTGLGSVGFPGTLGFIAADMLVDGAVEATLTIGLLVVAAAALNGIAVVRGYFKIFTGTRHPSTISLRVGVRERLAVLALTALIIGGGLYPQPGVASRYDAAKSVLDEREIFRTVQASEFVQKAP